MKFDVIILAGGLGTRLQSVVADVPKPMAPVANQPFLNHILKLLPLANINKIILSVGYKYQKIEAYYGKSFENIPIVYSIEDEPLGTGGGIKLALAEVQTEHCLIMNGDTYFDIDLEQFWQVHLLCKHNITLALKQVENPDRYGTVLLQKNQIIKFSEKEVGLKLGLINGGVYWFNMKTFNDLPSVDKFSFESDFLEKKVNQLKMGGYIDGGLFIDIGIPTDYERAQSIFA